MFLKYLFLVFLPFSLFAAGEYHEGPPVIKSSAAYHQDAYSSDEENDKEVSDIFSGMSLGERDIFASDKHFGRPLGPTPMQIRLKPKRPLVNHGQEFIDTKESGKRGASHTETEESMVISNHCIDAARAAFRDALNKRQKSLTRKLEQSENNFLSANLASEASIRK